MTVEEFAPAKINLALHVTGQREDGYHLLDSLVAFADVGDVVRVSKSTDMVFSVVGPHAADVPVSDDNLVLKAARLFKGSFDIVLEKNLPVASGIGGGSADAAATLKAICKLLNRPHPDLAAQLALGADVPVCMMGGIVRMRGVGEALEPLNSGGISWPMVLVNPGIPVSTPQVFERLQTKANSPLADPYELGPLPHQQNSFLDWLAAQRNDLEPPACQLVPEISNVLAELGEASGCKLARMSGSGATCFGIFANDDLARAAHDDITGRHSDWWIALSIGQGY